MEPRKVETPVEFRSEDQTSPPRRPETKRRFQIVKLEDRIAPGGTGNGHGGTSRPLFFSCNGNTMCCSL